MKKLLLLITVSFLFIACKNSNKEDVKNENQQPTVKGIAANAPVDEKTQKTQELKKTPQLTLERIRALLPHELDSAKEKNYIASNQFGYGLASVEYPKTRSRGIKVTLYDCAGEIGSTNYFENYWNYLNVNEETGQGFRKTIDFEGGKAVETYKKDMNLSTLTFVVRDRIVIVMEGKKMTPEELEEAAKELHQKIA
jgi:hypothetical protein